MSNDIADFIKRKFAQAKIDGAEMFINPPIQSPLYPNQLIPRTAAFQPSWNAAAPTPRPRSFSMPLEEFRALEVSSPGQLIDALIVKGRFLDIDVSDKFSIELGKDSVEVRFQPVFKASNVYGLQALRPEQYGQITASEIAAQQSDADYRMQQAIHQMSQKMSQNIDEQVLELLKQGVPANKIAIEQRQDFITGMPSVTVKEVK